MRKGKLFRFDIVEAWSIISLKRNQTIKDDGENTKYIF